MKRARWPWSCCSEDMKRSDMRSDMQARTSALRRIREAAVGGNALGPGVVFASELEWDLRAAEELDAAAACKRPQIRKGNLRVVLGVGACVCHGDG